MTNKKRSFLYLTLFSICFIVDRISKALVLCNVVGEINVFPGFQLDVVWNRGVTWGMFNFASQTKFMILSGFIIFVVLSFAVYSLKRLQQGISIVGEVIVLAGACSNITDRFLYGAVLDFIGLYVGTWHWPWFNIADMCVVVGVCLVAIKYVWDDYESKRTLS
jgi:signal peptidase II